MKVVLAEKPSVARDIAAVLGATTRKEGYFVGNEYIVTYAFGHLVTIAEPGDMNPVWGGPWRLEQLPMIPDDWKYTVAEKASAQFNVIKRLFTDPKTTSIICATDAGREGEHIFRLIYKLAGAKKPVQRLWISSLTTDAIKDGFRKLKPSNQFDDLAAAAMARAHADWLVGLNFTRAYTKLNYQLCTIGRVQTPTLAMIVERQNTIDAFKPEPFWEVIATFAPGFLARYITPGNEPQTRIPDKAQAQQVYDDVKPAPSGTVASVSTVDKKTKAPLLYDLLTLQRDANKRFGYTAKETLDLAQSLYEEHKLISYPRTESRHISTDILDDLPPVLDTVLRSRDTTQKVRDAFAALNMVPGSIGANSIRSRLGKPYVDNTKLTDHHAIIPTRNAPPSSVPPRARNVYDLIATRFLSIFLAPEVRAETTAIIKLANHSFRARGTVVKDPGWTITGALAQEESSASPSSSKSSKKSGATDERDEQPESGQILPDLTRGQQVDKRKVELKEGTTSPPKPYDDSSLLAAMKNAGKQIDDEELAAYMKQSGLGTPATRAAIIERLLQSGYIEREKKAIVPTPKGKALIQVVHPNLKDVALTAEWEQQLAEMQDGQLEQLTFEKEIGKFIREVLSKVVNAPRLPADAIQRAAAYAPGSPRRSDGAPPAVARHKRDTGASAPTGARSKRARRPTTANGQNESEDKMPVATSKALKTGRKTKPAQDSAEPQKPHGHSRQSATANRSTGNESQSATGNRSSGIQSQSRTDNQSVRSQSRSMTDSITEKNTSASSQKSAEGGAASKQANPGSQEFGTCPQCGEGIVRTTPNGAGCSRWRDGCKFSVWREQYGKTLTNNQIAELVKKGTTKEIKGFKKKDGSGTYDARLILSPEHKVRLSFADH